MTISTMRATTRTANYLLQVAHSRRPVLRTFHTTLSQRLQSTTSIKYQYLYFLGNNNPSATRSLSTTTATTPPPRSRSTPTIPAPTWSLQSLELSQTHAPVSEQELSRLTKRAVIDLTAMNSYSSNTNNSNSKTSLAQELGNMMHMIQQVQSPLPGNEMEHLTDVAIYDVPRGVTAAPVRREEDTPYTDASSTSTSTSHQRPVWWESLLKPHTTTVGAHSYFAVCTQRDEKKSE